MRPQQSGSIVLTASVSGLTAWSHAAPYCATKAAVIQLAKVAAVEYARDGIRVNCVCPGTFLSGIHDGPPAGGASTRSRRKHPLGLGDGRRSGRRVLVPRERRVPLDDRRRRSSSTAATRRRRRFGGRIADAAGHELVRGARAPRRPHAGQAARGLRRRDRHLRRDGRRGRPRWPAGCTTRGVGARRRRRAALVQLHRVPGDDLRRQLPRRDRDADQLAARGAGGALHPRALRGPRAGVRRGARRPRERRRRTGIERDLVRVVHRATGAATGGRALADLRAGRERRRRACRRPATTSTG